MNIKRMILWALSSWILLESVLVIGVWFVALFGFLSFTLFGTAWGTLLTASLVLPFIWGVTHWSFLPWFRRLTLERSH